MKVVSNTSPLINLAWIGQLEILHIAAITRIRYSNRSQ